MSAQTQETKRRRRTAAELRQRHTRDLLRDVHKLRGVLRDQEIPDVERRETNEDVRLIERELRGRTGGKSQ